MASPRTPRSPAKSPRFTHHNPPVSASSRLSTSKSASGSEYVNIGTPEETVLETYFVMLSKFNFDRARDQCDREREGKSSSGGTNWCDFMGVLSRLASIEVNYFSLTFMERSWSDSFRLVKKESLRSTYEAIIQDLKRVQDIYKQRRGGTDFSWERKMAELVTHVTEFVAAKRDMTEFYVRFDVTDGCHLDYQRLQKYLKDMTERYKDSFQHIFLKPVKSTFQRELGVLGDLLSAQQHISEWDFLPAILDIQASHSKLSIWNGVVPLGSQGDQTSRQHMRSIRTRPMPPLQRDVGPPYLYKWFCKFHAALLAKFSLYFHQVLSEHASVYDMKHLSDMLDADYVTSLFGIIRHTPAVCTTLVFDSTGLPEFKGPKYHCPDSPSPTLTGINAYPFMIKVPHDFDFYHHRPNIVSLIIDKSHQLSTSTQLVSQYDGKLECTYHMTQVDPRVTLVAICSSRGRDRDSKTTAMLADTASQLRNTHVAALLKPGT